MLNQTKKLILIASVCFIATKGMAKTCAATNPALLVRGEELLSAMEAFDETLHDAGAPVEMIGLNHHFEEGLMDLIEGLKMGSSCQEAVEDFQHFHEDVQLVYRALDRRPDLFQGQVLKKWNILLPTFVRFQNTLY